MTFKRGGRKNVVSKNVFRLASFIELSCDFSTSGAKNQQYRDASIFVRGRGGVLLFLIDERGVGVVVRLDAVAIFLPECRLRFLEESRGLQPGCTGPSQNPAGP
jgi:hypothetical protein